MEHVDKIGGSVTQRTIGAAMALEAKYSLAEKAANNQLDYSGFKEPLIDGGQNGWAMVHIQGIAGASLAGSQSTVDKQIEEDKNQLKVGLDWQKMGRKVIPYGKDSEYPLDKYIAEKRAEVADDDAGIYVAGFLSDKLNGRKTHMVAKLAIFNLLCDR